MADKPRVYQGVRVKTTVKELLQRHRAREACSKKAKTISQACLELQELCASTFTGRYVDPPPAVPVQPRPAATAAAAASLPVPDGSCSGGVGVQLQESVFHDTQQQFADMSLPGNSYSYSGGGGGYAASLPPLPALPLPWCHGLSSDADYYGHAATSCSPPDSLALCSPDSNSYSPQDSSSFSSSSSSCYNSPVRVDFSSFPLDSLLLPPCSLQDCYCSAPCWPEACPAPEYAAHYPAPSHAPTDYPYAGPAPQDQDYLCYNVL